MNTRTPRRNRLFLIGAAPAAVMLFLALQLGLALKANHDGRSAYDDHDYADAVSSFLDAPGLVEGWVGPFDAGAAAYRGGEFREAVGHFEDALSDVPDEHECDVRRDLALAHEEVGDRLFDHGQSVAAREEYAAGRSALAEGDCLDETGVKLDRRLESKEEGRVEEPDEGAALEPDEKLEELDQRNEQRQRNEDKPRDPSTEPDRQIQW